MKLTTYRAIPFTRAALVFSMLGAIGMTGLLAGCDKKAETPAAATSAAPAAPASTDATPPQQAAATPEKPSAAGKAVEPEAKPAAEPEHKAAAKKHAAKSSSSHKQAEDSASSEKKTATHICDNCGTITAINAVEQEGEGSGLGAIAGGVAGAVLGHQVGGGTGKDLATIAGAAGGAYAGHQIEKKMKKTVRYDITVKTENGKHHTFSQKEAPAFAVGDKVKIVDGKLEAN